MPTFNPTMLVARECFICNVMIMRLKEFMLFIIHYWSGCIKLHKC